MNESIHGEKTASERQDRSSSVAHSVEVPSEIVRKWQEFVNLLAEIMHVPSASIMRVDPPLIKVFVSSSSKGNLCEPGAVDTGPYCETVMKTGQPLLVPDARENEAWKANPHVRLGMISYLGFPIAWPDGRLFGTICVRDNKRNEYSEAYLKLLLHFRDILQADLKSFATLHGQLEQHEAKIRRLVDANIIGIIIWDLEGRILDANDAFLHMGGYDREDLISGRLNRTDLTPPEWRERDARTDAELKMNGVVQPFEKEYFRKDGGRVPVLIGLAAFGEERDEGVAFVLDLTERKRAEEALRGSEAKFRDYAESASDWYWETDPDHKFARVTDYERLLDRGFTPVSRIGLARWEFATDVESEPEKWERHRSMLEARQPFRDFVYRATRSAGSLVYYKISGKPIYDAKGAFLGYRGTGTDVTAAMRAQEEHERLLRLESDLAHMNRLSMMGELAASLSHELTQPIASARNNTHAAQNFLNLQPPDLREVREALSGVMGDIDRAGDLVDRIRDHIKKAPPRKDRLDLNKAIDEVIVLGRTAIIKNGVSVQTRLSEELSPIHGDRVQLQQVVLNLILNAVEAMGSSKAGVRELSISTEQHHNGILVAVRDSGQGIDPPYLERVFDAFYTTKSSGMGMGLSICRSIIEAHGGRLWATGSEPRGALFQFTIPAD
jgi:PAS domain S-box-containing protein